MQIDTGSLISRGDDHVEAPMDGEFALMHVENGKFFAVREVTAEIWRLIDDPKPVAQIISALLDEYEVSEEECAKDVIDVLSELHNQGLIKVG
ncbi:MAG: PqqD family peptide modification chaperone [Alphaproteobacteria bacterium]